MEVILVLVIQFSINNLYFCHKYKLKKPDYQLVRFFYAYITYIFVDITIREYDYQEDIINYYYDDELSEWIEGNTFFEELEKVA
jgi:hypothetical protein